MTTNCPSAGNLSAYFTGRWQRAETLRPGGLDLTARAMAACGLAPGQRILDLGCGAGVSTRYLREVLDLDVIGLDISRSSCELTAKVDDVGVIQADAVSLPLASGSIDAILCECTLSLVSARSNVLAECRRVLRPQGRLVITDMYARNSQAVATLRALPTNCISGMLIREKLDAELANYGYSVVVWEDHSEVLTALMFKFVMKHGDPEQIWAVECLPVNERASAKQALKAARPGYFLLVAEKRTATTTGGRLS